MKTILFPTDFSDQARTALEYTLMLAKKMQAKVMMLHVFWIPTQNDAHPQEIRSREQQFHNEAHRKFEALMESVQAAQRGVSVEYHVRNGYLVQEIAAMSKVCRVDLIVTATKGASGLNEVRGSSISAELIAKTNCPVWVIPTNVTAKPIQQIAVAIDYHDSDVYMLEELVRLAALFDAQLTLLHVCETEKDPEMEAVYLHRLHKQVVCQTGYAKISQQVLPGNDLLTSLKEYLELHPTDLLVMATRDKQLLEQTYSRSQTKQMAYLTQTPLLAYHAYDFPAKNRPGQANSGQVSPGQANAVIR